MIYSKENWTANFLNASGANDEDAVRDLILDEVSDLILESPEELAAAIYPGKDLKKTPLETQMASTLIKNLGADQDMKREVAVLILKRQQKTGNNVEATALLTKQLGEVFSGDKKLLNKDLQQLLTSKAGIRKTVSTGMVVLGVLTVIGFIMVIQNLGGIYDGGK